MSFSLLSAANIRTLFLVRREIFLWKLKILHFNWFKIESSSLLYDCLLRVLFHNIFVRISALTGQLCWLTQWPNTSLIFVIFQLTITLLLLFFLFQILNQDLLLFSFITSSIRKSQKTLKFVFFMWYIFIESCRKRFIWSWEVWRNSYFWKWNIWKPWEKVFEFHDCH